MGPKGSFSKINLTFANFTYFNLLRTQPLYNIPPRDSPAPLHFIADPPILHNGKKLLSMEQYVSKWYRKWPYFELMFKFLPLDNFRKLFLLFSEAFKGLKLEH